MRGLLTLCLILFVGFSWLKADSAPGFDPIGCSPRGDIIAHVGAASYETDKNGNMVPAKIRLYRLSEDKTSFRLFRTIVLIQKYEPNSVLVTENAEYVVTFDSAVGIGRGKHVVAVYGADGQMLKSWSLEEILAPDDFKKAPQSVSSTWWRLDARVMGRTILVSGPMKRIMNEEVSFYRYLLDLEKLEWRKIL